MSKKTHKKTKVTLLEHSYDGIQEFDQHLPNWWLITFYGAMVFSVFYWFVFFQSNSEGVNNVPRLESELARIESAKLAGAIANLDNDMLWKMSRNAEVVASGKETYVANCASCHGPELKGGIGVNLVDDVWIHGPLAMDHYNLIKAGYAPKGMPTWGPILGDKKIAEVTAFILSHHAVPADPNGADHAHSQH